MEIPLRSRSPESQGIADQPLQAAEEGSMASEEARSLLSGGAVVPTPGRCLGSRAHCLVVSLGVAALIVASVLGTAGIWMTMDDGQESSSADIRGLSAPPAKGANVTGSGAGAASTRDGRAGSPCDTPLCRAEARLDSVKHWDGWSRVAPFLVTGTETSGTATETTTSTETATTTTTTTTTTVTTTTTTTTTATETTTTTTNTTPCMVLEEGDDCYKEVLDVLYDIRDNPDSRDGLTLWSSFEEVQTWLHQSGGKSKCLDACECQVAPMNSHCHSSLVFARESGIREHPEWYPNLTEESSTYDFQDYFWKFVNETECLRPCKAFAQSDPSLFCWSVVRQDSYEADVIRAQLTAGAGIFGCDGFAVVSEEEWSVGWGPGGRIGEVNALSFASASVGVSKDGTAGNAQLFMNAWDAILERTLVLEFDWSIKVDPDAVVVADRLRDHVRDSTGSSVFVRNCNKEPDSPDFPMMFGSLETISREGLRVYKDASHRCRSELSWYSWGEDLFLGKCLLHLGVAPLDDFSIISDGVCTGVNCNDGWSAAFHPFKDSNEWMNCWNAATNDTGGRPPPPLP